MATFFFLIILWSSSFFNLCGFSERLFSFATYQKPYERNGVFELIMQLFFAGFLVHTFFLSVQIAVLKVWTFGPLIFFFSFQTFHFSKSAILTLGLLEHLIPRHLDPLAFGLQDRWTIKPLDRLTVGQLGRWTTGTLNCWTVGPFFY